MYCPPLIVARSIAPPLAGLVSIAVGRAAAGTCASGDEAEACVEPMFETLLLSANAPGVNVIETRHPRKLPVKK